MTTQKQALEAALSALESERIMAKDVQGNYTVEVTPKRIIDAIEKVKAALAEPEQEPVAHIYPSTLKKFQVSEAVGECYSVAVGCPDEVSVPVYTSPQPREPEQEPVTTSKVAQERDKLMQMVQEYASTWAIVGGRFDDGSAFEEAKKSKDSIFMQVVKLATISFEIGLAKTPSPQPREWQELAVTDGMAIAFHRALTDAPIGSDELEDIKSGLRAALVNSCQPREWEDLWPPALADLMKDVDTVITQHPEFDKSQREWVTYIKISAALRAKNGY